MSEIILMRDMAFSTNRLSCTASICLIEPFYVMSCNDMHIGWLGF